MRTDVWTLGVCFVHKCHVELNVRSDAFKVNSLSLPPPPPPPPPHPTTITTTTTKSRTRDSRDSRDSWFVIFCAGSSLIWGGGGGGGEGQPPTQGLLLYFILSKIVVKIIFDWVVREKLCARQ